MGFILDIAEIAALLLVAYTVGWLAGYVAHRLMATTPKADAVQASPLVATPAQVPVEDALVKAPLVGAVTSSPPPQIAAAAAVLEPITATVGPNSSPTSQPRLSGIDRLKSLATTMPLTPVAEPVTVTPAALEEPALPVPSSAIAAAEPVEAVSPIPPPELPPAPTAVVPQPGRDAPRETPLPSEPAVADGAPSPASAAGMPWAGAMNGHQAERFAQEAPSTGAAASADAAEIDAEPDAALDVALLSSLADQLKPVSPDIAAPVDAADPVPAIDAVVEEPAAKAEPPEPPQIPVVPPAPEPAAPLPLRRPALDEDAAMRAIEGGWSRRDVRAPSDAPELADVNAAVSAAQVAVEQVLARNGVDADEPQSRTQSLFGKPAGLQQPRDGRRDDLRRIGGLGPLDEVTLNNLGIYHFDQIAGWTEREVLWLENHAFAIGRVAREDWQGQARQIMAERNTTRAAR